MATIAKAVSTGEIDQVDWPILRMRKTAASGANIGTITSYASTPGCFTYDVAFWTGLTIVTATPDVTVSFR